MVNNYFHCKSLGFKLLGNNHITVGRCMSGHNSFSKVIADFSAALIFIVSDDDDLKKLSSFNISAGVYLIFLCLY